MENFEFTTIDVTTDDMKKEEERSAEFLKKKTEDLKNIMYASVEEMKHYADILHAAVKLLETSYPDMDDQEDREHEQKYLDKLSDKIMHTAKHMEAVADFSDDYYSLCRSYEAVNKDKTVPVVFHSAVKSMDKVKEACYGHNVKEVYGTDEDGEKKMLFDVDDLTYPREFFRNTITLYCRMTEDGSADPGLRPCEDRMYYEYIRKELLFIHNEMLTKTLEECEMTEFEYLKALNAVSAGITACEVLIEEARRCMRYDDSYLNWLHFISGSNGYSAMEAIAEAEYYAPVTSYR